jgi:hypothetical protein
MASTSLIALAAMLMLGSAKANDAHQHVVAVATARATIVSGVRSGVPTEPVATEQRDRRDMKPHERTCPESAQTPCRLIVIDQP